MLTPGGEPLLIGDHPDPGQQLRANFESLGTEYFKVLFSRVEIQLAPLQQPAALLHGQRLAADPLNRLFQNTLGGTKRGDALPAVPPDWFTVTLPYRVIQ